MKRQMKGGTKEMKNKTTSLVLATILLASILATGFALAETEIEVDNASAIIPSEDVTSADVSVDETAYKRVGSAAVTYAQGYATSGDNGYLLNALWGVHTFSKIAKEDVQAIREQYKGNKTAMEQALKEAAKEEIVKNSAGKLELGIGKDNERYQLNLTSKSADNKTASFDVLAINTKEKVGTLSLTGKGYSQFTLWTGTLSIDSGDKAGTYSVSLASKTALVKNPGKGNSENASEGNREKKQGFWQNLFSFGRNKGKAQQQNQEQ
jgi:hypothetical protein